MQADKIAENIVHVLTELPTQTFWELKHALQMQKGPNQTTLKKKKKEQI